tara:strand:- start:180 stop:410 length:231 start_codon:yes stop_codon:yes gene_type:complete
MNNLVAGDIMMARIKELETELAELKASLPQIKHDAVMSVVELIGYENWSVRRQVQFNADVKAYYIDAEGVRCNLVW